MQDILRQSNLDLLREIDCLSRELAKTSVPAELSAYQDQVSRACDGLRQLVVQNLLDLELNIENTFNDILSQTQSLTVLFRLYNQRIAPPLLRHRSSDRLCLRIITWLHNYHPKTKGFPAGLSDGEFGIWPQPHFPIIYFMPSSRQHGLLYLSLFFHEFGHLLYACHKEEMDQLVRDLQEDIAHTLEPVSQRNDRYARQDAKIRNVIVETWYEWTQELFCDAVGLTIGGPCFAHAFSMYLRMSGRGSFYRPREKLGHSVHPVAWLRVRLITERARQMNMVEADRLKNEWTQIAETMEIDEDYHGFYDDRSLSSIHKTIDDMLTETSPYRFSTEDVCPSNSDVESYVPVRLLNRAWYVFLNDPDSYAGWEEDAISAFLQ